MALRVLLGDESATIKKVIQLALQDYSVEVKSVHMGLDVIDVARSFQPHIIFMDVLLQKKNGYEVCADIKADSELSEIPVVLMWSSFMSLDEEKYQECQAQARLEKPFEVDDLRSIVQKNVALARENKVSPYLSFAPSITEEFKEEERKRTPSDTTPSARPETKPSRAPAPTPKPAVEPNSSPELEAYPSMAPSEEEEAETEEKDNWSMEDFDNLSEFALEEVDEDSDSDSTTESFSTTSPGSSKIFQDTTAESDPWSSRNLDEFRLDLQDSEDDDFVITTLEDSPPQGSAMELTQLDGPDGEDEPSVSEYDSSDLSSKKLELSEDLDEIDVPPPKMESLLNPSVKKMVEDYMERTFHMQLEARLEKALREMLPEVASRVIKEEIHRLTRDLE